MNAGPLVGHARARTLLARALGSGAVHPAYLFTGPPGVGKHLAAREFCRALLCPEGGGGACGACDSCRQFTGGTHPDWIEVVPNEKEKKKTIGVDQVRDLGAWLAQSAMLGARKAAILVPADKMTREAANALLKTLEEPPQRRAIVLVATRPGALPATVRSRCQHVAFGPLGVEEVAEVLRRNGWPAQAARQAAALADGSPGTALQRDGKGWQAASLAVLAVLDALEAGDRGAALAFAEAAADPRERAVLSLQALAGLCRLAMRLRLGDRAVDRESVPLLLRRVSGDHIDRLLSGALETQRRLEGDRPPNAKLALANLLAGAAAPGARP